ncbi:MAG: DNA ligase, partial [Clostridia bacterium]
SKFSDRYTTNMRKEKRKGKIFVDWVRNGRGATSVAPYSLRAREGARVAMPISWDELDTMPPDGITITEALARLNASDPWEQFANIKQRIKP